MNKHAIRLTADDKEFHSATYLEPNCAQGKRRATNYLKSHGYSFVDSTWRSLGLNGLKYPVWLRRDTHGVSVESRQN